MIQIQDRDNDDGGGEEGIGMTIMFDELFEDKSDED